MINATHKGAEKMTFAEQRQQLLENVKQNPAAAAKEAAYAARFAAVGEGWEASLKPEIAPTIQHKGNHENGCPCGNYSGPDSQCFLD